jgi:hypothetical protein
MIARLTFEWAGESTSAELTDDLAWSCDHPTYGADVARYLTALFDPKGDLSPSLGMPGRAPLGAAADFLEATIEWGEPPPGARDGLY